MTTPLGDAIHGVFDAGCAGEAESCHDDPFRTTMSSQIHTGRLLVITAIAVSLCGNAAADLFSRHFSPVAWLLTIGLFYALWRGQRWARWLMVGLLGSATLFAVWTLLSVPSLFLVFMAVQFVLVGSLLAFSTDVSAFLNFQRTRSNTVVPRPEPPRAPQEHVDPY